VQTETSSARAWRRVRAPDEARSLTRSSGAQIEGCLASAGRRSSTGLLDGEVRFGSDVDPRRSLSRKDLTKSAFETMHIESSNPSFSASVFH
jgi:hypothetical protein